MIMNKYRPSNQGFTLVELMVTMVVAFLVIAAVYASFVVQQRTQTGQQQVTRIQQNLRAATVMMTREFKMAGYDPTLSGEYGITQADKNIFVFTADRCEDGGIPKLTSVPLCPGAAPTEDQPLATQRLDETYIYQLFDTDADGINDALQRVPVIPPTPPNNPIAIAENIEQVEFSYVMDTGTVQEKVNTGQLSKIRAIQITILARADQPDYNYANVQTYTTRFGKVWDPSNPIEFPIDNSLNYRRRVLLATIELRNMGLL